jgi:hypothetical protein
MPRRSTAPMSVAAVVAFGSTFLFAFTAQAAGSATLKRAQGAFEYGDFKLAAELLSASAALETDDVDRLESFRLLGLSHHFLLQPEQAEAAFVSMLKLSPDAVLDPFYVPPDAVAFFDAVRQRHAGELAPIKARLASRPSPPAATETAPAPCVPAAAPRQPVERHSRLVTLLPLGAGQLQNGRTLLGGTFLAAQLAAAATSVAAYWNVEAARGPDGRFASGVFDSARQASEVRLWSGAAFYALWAASSLEANVRFVPEVTDVKDAQR